MIDWPEFSDGEQGWRNLALGICVTRNRLMGIKTDVDDVEFCLTGRLDDVLHDTVLCIQQIQTYLQPSIN